MAGPRNPVPPRMSRSSFLAGFVAEGEALGLDEGAGVGALDGMEVGAAVGRDVGEALRMREKE